MNAYMVKGHNSILRNVKCLVTNNHVANGESRIQLDC